VIAWSHALRGATEGSTLAVEDLNRERMVDPLAELRISA
jgi:hypothetical protein